MTPTARRRAPGTAVLVTVVLAVVLALTALSLAGAGPFQASEDVDRPATGAPAEPAPDDGESSPEPEPPPPPPDAVLTVVGGGDILLHQSVTASARTADGGYDYAPLFEPVQPWLHGADLALCHLEVPVAPAGSAPSGYPAFGAPVEIASSLAAAGWDGCSTASNHSLDRGMPGVVATLDAMDAAGLGHVGTARSATEAASPQVYELEREGQTIRVAHLSATYGTNGIPLPADAPWAVTLLDTSALVEAATAARAAGADLVIASVHCCVEYVYQPTEEQRRIAAELAASGVVDLVLGHHAHVSQPVERLEGGPRGEGMWVAHGLGNFLSNQYTGCCAPGVDTGLLLTATVRKPADGPAAVVGAEWTAVTVDRAGGHRVHPLLSTALDQPLGTLGPAELALRLGRVTDVVGPDAPERVVPPEPTGPAPAVVRRPVETAAGRVSGRGRRPSGTGPRRGRGPQARPLRLPAPRGASRA